MVSGEIEVNDMVPALKELRILQRTQTSTCNTI